MKVAWLIVQAMMLLFFCKEAYGNQLPLKNVTRTRLASWQVVKYCEPVRNCPVELTMRLKKTAAWCSKKQLAPMKQCCKDMIEMPDEHKRFQDMLRICKWHIKRNYYEFLELKKYYGLPKKPKSTYPTVATYPTRNKCRTKPNKPMLLDYCCGKYFCEEWEIPFKQWRCKECRIWCHTVSCDFRSMFH